MKTNLLKLTLGLSLLAFTQNTHAQCPEITCLPDVTSGTDSAMCDAIVTFGMPTATDTCLPGGSQTFSYTGAQQTFVVPAGVTSISVDAYGAQGGSNSPSTNINYGGRVQADLPVTPGTTIYVYVGEQPTGLTGGWNGGGNGETAGIGGGGASDLRIGGTTYTERVIVAGGAGGGGFWSGQEVNGGLGGGLVGGNGYRVDFSTAPGGDGGTQTSSGNGTCASLNNPICSGGFGFGGAPSGCGCEGYGGGGGWYGGAGSGNCRGGGGGSSYTDASASNVVHTQGVQMGNGQVTISWSGGVPTITQIGGLPSGSTFPIGTTTNTFIAESNGGVDTCSFAVIVTDTELPTIICSGDITYCEGANVNGTAPITADNCSGEFVTYTMTGATTGSGTNDVDNQLLNVGTTMVTYVVTDAAGNQDSCSFNIIVNPAPPVVLDAFNPDSLCNYNDPIALPNGNPASGTYAGTGISGSNFDPSISGNGTFAISYTVTDANGCTNSDTTSIFVDACAGLSEFNPLSNISVFPNPSNGLFTVSCDDLNGSFEYIVTSTDGKIIRQRNISSDSSVSLDLSNEPNGTYLIHIENGEFNRTLKLVKD